ncbi:hypothetical protein AB205_0000940 [Aquarana catesbeiana]|uniref:Uncharacterized protein n=1 Tax=Aquarana catesbeiana TaxID=8400 RepID=A0A2G9RYP2_AQUCT|nr:hypothetical protein AB205_0000940 [Aquarana catesbeiana]
MRRFEHGALFSKSLRHDCRVRFSSLRAFSSSALLWVRVSRLSFCCLGSAVHWPSLQISLDSLSLIWS